jgi:hypothetical protein
MIFGQVPEMKLRVPVKTDKEREKKRERDRVRKNVRTIYITLQRGLILGDHI